MFDNALKYGAGLEDIDHYNVSELDHFSKLRMEKENEMIIVIRELLRWHVMILVKMQSKEGLKSDDLLFEDEKEKIKVERLKRAKKNSKKHQAIFDRWDADMKRKHKKK